MRKGFVEPVELPEPRFRDGLGIRYVRTDGTDDPVEVLRPLWDVGAMQNAIRQRVSRLATFRQARFVPVRAAEVPRDDASTIEVVSDYLTGYRLSQYLEASHDGTLSIEASTAIYVLRELLGALALLHESRGVTHGAVGPERILITPKGRVVVADYVLGPAIERLEFSRPRLWREFRIPLPVGKGLAKLDQKADVVQVGVTALALLLGRPIEPAEYPGGLDDLVTMLNQTRRDAGRPSLHGELVRWVKRAVLKDPGGKFENVSDARMSLEAVVSKQDAAGGGAAALKSLAERFGQYAAAQEARAAAAAAEEARKAALAAQASAMDTIRTAAAGLDAAGPAASSMPAFGLLSEMPAAPQEGAVEVDPPVGWRVPEAPPVEETLPTSPLLQIDAPADAPPAEAFIEEVLDLTELVGPDDADLAAAAGDFAAEAVAATADQVEAQVPVADIGTADATVEIILDLRELNAAEAAVEAALATLDTPAPEAPPEALPEWRLLADPVGAIAPTIDVEVPTQTLEELVAEFAAAANVHDAPSAEVDRPLPTAVEPPFEMEPPATVVEPPVSIIEEAAPVFEPPVAMMEDAAPIVEPPVAMIEEAAPAVEPLVEIVEEAAPVIEPPVAMIEEAAPAVEPLVEMVEEAAPVIEPPDEHPAPVLSSVSDAVLLPDEASSVLDEILGLQEAQAAAQAAAELRPEPPPTEPDIAAWSFVEELMHRDARYEARPAVYDEQPPEQVAEEPALQVPAIEVEFLQAAIAAVPEDVQPALPSVAAAQDDACAGAPTETGDIEAVALPKDAPPPIEEIAPELPSDWFIEVGSRPATEAPVFTSPAEPAEAWQPPLPAAPIEPPSPVFTEGVSESAVAEPTFARRPMPPEPEEDLSGPVFPRVAPSVRRVRAEARRRRLARLGGSIGLMLQAFVSACASGIGALAGGIGQVFSAAGRGTAAGIRAIAAGILGAATALLRGIGGAARAAAAGGAAVVRAVSAAGAAAAHGAGALLSAAADGAGRGLRAFASALVSSAGIAAKSATAVLRAGAVGISASARALTAGLSALGHAGSTAAAATARGAAAVSVNAGRAAGRAAEKAASAAFALGSLTGRAVTSIASGIGSTMALGASGIGRAVAIVGGGVVRAAVLVTGAMGRAVGGAASAAAALGGRTRRGAALSGNGIGRAAMAVPRRIYFAASDLAELLPRPVFRPWYLVAALVVIVAVAGVPYLRDWWSTNPPALGTIRVESARPDAAVSIDGVPQGRAPVTASVPAGRHRIEVAVAGETRAHEVDVVADRETLVQAAGADLKGVGSVRVSTDPAGVEVLVDGVLRGRSPLTVENLAEGPHTILVRDGSGSVRQSVRVLADEAVDATLQIRPGWLAVFAPVKLDVLENGRSIGSTERGRILAAPGPHTIDVVSESIGFRETRQVDIKPGAVAALTIQLPPATIEIVAPAEAEILVDGQPVGQAPLGPLPVAVGTREIVMRHPTLGERRQVVSVTYKSPVRIVFE